MNNPADTDTDTSRRSRRSTSSNTDLDASLRSTSSGVGCASSFLRNQISLRRSLNDWDESDPEVAARRRSLESDERMDAPRSEEARMGTKTLRGGKGVSAKDADLAFRPSGVSRRSDPDANIAGCGGAPSSSAAAAPGASNGNGAGFLRSSFVFEQDERDVLTMDASLRGSGGGALDAGDSAGSDEEYIGLVREGNDDMIVMDGEQDSVHSSQYSEHYSNNEEEYEQAVDFGLEEVPPAHLNLDEKIASSARTSQGSIHSSACLGHYSNTVDIGASRRPDRETSATESPKSDDSPSSIDTTCRDLETIIRTGQHLLNTNANTNYTRSNSGGYLADHTRSHSAGNLNEYRRYQRTLSQTSIVSLLKLQRICEKKEYMDDMKGIDLEQTVKRCGSEEEEGSVVSDLGESEREWKEDVVARVEDGDGDGDESLDRRSGDESGSDYKNAVKVHILPLDISEVADNCQPQNTKSKQQPSRSGSFLQQDCNRFPEEYRMRSAACWDCRRKYNRVRREDGKEECN